MRDRVRKKKKIYSIQAMSSSSFSTWEQNWSNIQMKHKNVHKNQHKINQTVINKRCIYMQMFKDYYAQKNEK